MAMTPQNDLITIPTIEDLTRREFMSSALLVACGEEDNSEMSSMSTTALRQ
jgi:hypothetical protein